VAAIGQRHCRLRAIEPLSSYGYSGDGINGILGNVPDFPYAQMAEMSGLDGVRASSAEQVAPAWEAALSVGPAAPLFTSPRHIRKNTVLVTYLTDNRCHAGLPFNVIGHG
jgi:hypothetical protein